MVLGLGRGLGAQGQGLLARERRPRGLNQSGITFTHLVTSPLFCSTFLTPPDMLLHWTWYLASKRVDEYKQPHMNQLYYKYVLTHLGQRQMYQGDDVLLLR